MVPWFSALRLKALYLDFCLHLKALTRFELPPYQNDGALAHAVHGLGLILVTIMACSGLSYYVIVALGIHSAEPDDLFVMQIHFLFANLVWVYLIIHAGIGLLHHILGHSSLRSMWSLKG
jgi:cytochrome b561